MAVIFDVKSPILGFESVARFEFEQIDDNFVNIKDVETGTTSFTLINPFVLREYNFEIPIAIKVLMSMTNETNLLVYNIVVIKTPLSESLINFVAPVIFNVDNKTMAQIVLDEFEHPEFGPIEPLSTFIVPEE